MTQAQAQTIATSTVAEYWNAAQPQPHTQTQPVPAPVPFFPFRPNFPIWEGDLAYTGSDYLLLNTQKDSTQDPTTDKSNFVVWIDKEAMKGLQHLTARMAPLTGECAAMLLAKPLNGTNSGNQILVYDFFIPEQDATGAHVEIDMGDVQRYTDYLQNTYPEHCTKMANNLHHMHSHANMQVFNSGTDIKQQEAPDQLGFQNDIRFFLIFNTRKEIRATAVMYHPVFHRFEDVPVGIYTGDQIERNHTFNSERKKELDGIMDALIKKPQPKTVYNYARANQNSIDAMEDFSRAQVNGNRPWYRQQSKATNTDPCEAYEPEELDGGMEDYFEDYQEVGETVRSMLTEAFTESVLEKKPYDQPLCTKLSIEISKAIIEARDRTTQALVETLQSEFQVFDEDGDYTMEYFTYHLVRLLMTEETSTTMEVGLEALPHLITFTTSILQRMEHLTEEVLATMEAPLFQGINSFSSMGGMPLHAILFANYENGLLEYLLGKEE